MKICPICNVECRDEAIFCDTCGHKFEEEAAGAVEIDEVEVVKEDVREAPVEPEASAPPVTPIPTANTNSQNSNNYNNNYNNYNNGYNGGGNNDNNGYMGSDNYYNGHIIPNRNIALAVVLTIVTCGIYGIYWMIMLNDEVNAAAEENNAMSGGIVFLLTLVTCGIYGWFWAYQMGERVDRIKNDPNGSSNILYLVLGIFGFQIVNYCLMQDALNTKFRNN